MARLRMAVIGVGHLGKEHARILAGLSTVELVGVVDVNLEQAHAIARRLGTRAYTFLFSVLCGRRVTDASSGFRAIRLSLFDDERINLWQDWLDRYELEPYLLFKALQLRHRVVEAPVTIEYPPPTEGLAYTKMRALVDWWKIFRPAVFLALRIKR